jgi:hypothetical protein
MLPGVTDQVCQEQFGVQEVYWGGILGIITGGRWRKKCWAAGGIGLRSGTAKPSTDPIGVL